MKMNAPNLITIFRMAMVPVFIALVLLDLPFAALAVFGVASLSDKLDGYLARKNDQVTTFGKFMDPLADKLLVMSAFLLFLQKGWMSVVAVFLILAREFLITSLRVLAINAGVVMPAGMSGKIKTAVQMTCICLMLAIAWLVGVLLPETFPVQTVFCVLGWLMAAVTVWSGADYVWKQRGLFRADKSGGDK